MPTKDVLLVYLIVTHRRWRYFLQRTTRKRSAFQLVRVEGPRAEQRGGVCAVCKQDRNTLFTCILMKQIENYLSVFHEYNFTNKYSSLFFHYTFGIKVTLIYIKKTGL